MEPIAIIGVACRFPGAVDATQYWANLVRRRSSITTLSIDELVAAGVPEAVATHPDYVRVHPRVPDFDGFDAGLFGMSEREAELTDPQLRMFIEVSHAALENSGYDPFGMDATVGVFGTSGPMTYGHRNLSGRRTAGNESLILMANNLDYVATQVSYRLNLHGPGVTVATACSSSLTAVHMACQSLRVGDCDVAVAGGVSFDLDELHGYWHVPGGIRSRSGRCRPLDERADGTVFGSGAGVIVLKPLADAVADGDHVRAVILGSATNNDGAGKMSFTAPSHNGQLACVQDALVSANVTPNDISYVEAHATGTALGDPIEIRALTDAWYGMTGPRPDHGSCPIGSVKSNIGHAGQASGVAGLIKLVLAFDHAQIPAMVGDTKLNPKLELESTPFFVPDDYVPWPYDPDRPRLAGLSSFGVGGTNVHLIVGEPPMPAPTPMIDRPRVVLWSARDEDAASELRSRISFHFKSIDGNATQFTDSVTVLQRGRHGYPVRGAVVSVDPADAVDVLAGGGSRLISGRVGDHSGAAFLFPGQGSLFPRAGHGLYREEQVFAAAVDEVLELCGARGTELRARWSSDEVTGLTDTSIAQPLLFAIEYAMAQLWQSWGVRPAYLIGHSLGELVAAAVAGVVDLADAVGLVCARADAMAAMPGGAMCAVHASLDSVMPLLRGDVVVAAVNGPTAIVLSGRDEDVGHCAKLCQEKGIRTTTLRTSHAFHSPSMSAAAERFVAAFQGVTLQPPSIPVISAATGLQLRNDEAIDPRFWARQLLEPVRFERALTTLLETTDPVLVEMGPGTALTTLARERRLTGQSDIVAVPTLPRPDRATAEPPRTAVLTAVATAWVHGVAVDWPSVDHAVPARRTEVPGYPYQRQRYWVDAPGQPTVQPGSPETDTTDAGPFSVLDWILRARPPVDTAFPTADALLLAPDDPAAERLALDACHAAGMRVRLVRPGAAFERRDDDFVARSGSYDDIRAVFTELADEGVRLGHLVHAATLATWAPAATTTVNEQLVTSFYGLLALVQEAGRHPAVTAHTRLHVLTTRSVDVSGSESVDPVKATLHGQIRTLGLEHAELWARLIDIGPGTRHDDVAHEMWVDDGESVVALRGPRRWVRVESAYQPEPASPPLRTNGVYVVTGGHGGIGRVVAEGLARTGVRPTIVLLGRRGTPEDTSDPRAAQFAELMARTSALGAVVRAVTCDVGIPDEVRATLRDVRQEFGVINGVLHLAGVAGSGMLSLRDPARAAEVLAPKVLGTVALCECLANEPGLDFVALFGSRAGVSGLRGGGDYAAANAFLDSFAATVTETRAVSVDWPEWSRVGMAAAASAGLHDGERVGHHAELDQSTTWMLNEHRFDGTAVLPGTAHIDLVVRAFRSTTAHAGPVMLTDVVFTTRLAVRTATRLRVVFSDGVDGCRVRTESRTPTGWRVHLTASIATRPDIADRTVDLDSLRATMQECPPPTIADSNVEFGPRWHNIVAAHRSGAERLLELRLPERFAEDFTEHALHPAILDNATAGARDADEPQALPFLYRRMVVHGDIGPHMYSYIRRSPDDRATVLADVDVVRPDGTVAVQIEGYAMYPAALDAGDTGIADDDVVSGIDPDTGVDLLLQLLAARTPTQVVVRPFRDGAPTSINDRPGPVVERRRATTARRAEPSSGDTGELLRAMWRDILGGTDFSDDDNFFEIGGSSLSAVELMTRIRDEFRVELSIAVLLDAATLGALIETVKACLLP